MQPRQKEIGDKMMQRAVAVGGYYSKRLQKKVPAILDRYFSIIFNELAEGNIYPRCNRQIRLDAKELTKDMDQGEIFCSTYPYKKFVVNLGTDFENDSVTFVPNEKYMKLIEKNLSKNNGCQIIVNRYEKL